MGRASSVGGARGVGGASGVGGACSDLRPIPHVQTGCQGPETSSLGRAPTPGPPGSGAQVLRTGSSSRESVPAICSPSRARLLVLADRLSKHTKPPASAPPGDKQLNVRLRLPNELTGWVLRLRTLPLGALRPGPEITVPTVRLPVQVLPRACRRPPPRCALNPLLSVRTRSKPTLNTAPLRGGLPHRNTGHRHAVPPNGGWPGQPRNLHSRAFASAFRADFLCVEQFQEITLPPQSWASGASGS